MQPLTVTDPMGSTCRVGTLPSFPYLSLIITPPLTFQLSHSLSMLEALPLQQPRWCKRLRVSQPLALMVQHSNITHGESQKESPLEVRTDSNPQFPSYVDLDLVTTSLLAPAHMLRFIRFSAWFIYWFPEAFLLCLLFSPRHSGASLHGATWARIHDHC